MPNKHHAAMLRLIKGHAGKATQHTFLDKYLGTTSPRYPISVPVLRKIAKDWMKEHVDLRAAEIAELTGVLAGAKSSTEKIMAGFILDYATPEQRKFNPELFETWLTHVCGWAEVDALCSGKYTMTEIPPAFQRWKKILTRMSRSKNIQLRRASLVMLTAPLRETGHEALAMIGIEIIDRLKYEREILITKAISWLLRTMSKHHEGIVRDYIAENLTSLPAIAVRETKLKLSTGKKTKGKKALPDQTR